MFQQPRGNADVWPIERGLSDTLNLRYPAVHAGSRHIGTRSFVRTTPEIMGSLRPGCGYRADELPQQRVPD